MGSRGNGTTLQRLCWLVVVLAVILWQAPDFIASLYPSRTVTYDFYQDWASARNSLNGDPVYADISLTIERYLGWPMPENWPARYWRMNFHPPPAVLLTLPLAWLEYPDAFLLWSLISLVALAATAWLLVRQLNVRPSTQYWLTIIAVLLAWYPFQQQVMQGQVNLVLLLMLTGIWVAHRSGRYRIAGAVLGAATAVKLFPGLLFLYFVLRRQWTVVVSAVVSLVMVTALSVAVLGSTTYVDYVTDVLPVSDQWLSHWYNTSLMALWTKLFNPGPAGGNIVPAWQSAGLARVGGWLSCAVVAATLVWAILRAKSRPDLDQTFGLTVTAMLLISPITWSQNLVLLIFPLALMGSATIQPRTVLRVALIGIVLILFVPPHKVWGVFIPGGWPDGTVRPWQTLTALSFQCFSVLGFFFLQLFWNARPPLESRAIPSGSPDATGLTL